MDASSWSGARLARNDGHAGRAAACRASVFEPSGRMTSADGPIQQRPAPVQAPANAAFSDRKP